jgi:hypothetical protein
MNSLLITYIVVGLGSINWRLKLLKHLPMALGLTRLRGAEREYYVERARKDLFIYAFGFVFRFIATWALLLFITEFIGLKINNLGSLILFGAFFVLSVSFLSRFVSRIEEIKIFKDYSSQSGFSPFTSGADTDLVSTVWFIPWIIIFFAWLLVFLLAVAACF